MNLASKCRNLELKHLKSCMFSLSRHSCWFKPESVFSGSYFANHFIMGGEKFDSTHPEGYLFGENTDLNFLGTRPVAVSVKSLTCFCNFYGFEIVGFFSNRDSIQI